MAHSNRFSLRDLGSGVHPRFFSDGMLACEAKKQNIRASPPGGFAFNHDRTQRNAIANLSRIATEESSGKHPRIADRCWPKGMK